MGRPLELPNIAEGIRGINRGGKQAIKRKALQEINKVAKRKVNDLFGEWILSFPDTYVAYLRSWLVCHWVVDGEKYKREGWSYLHAQNDLTTVGWRALYERNVKNEDDKAVLYDIYQR